MATRASLRRTLRTIPIFRSLSSAELDAIEERVVDKEYRQGSTLWRAGTTLDFLVIVREGEIVVEYRRVGTGNRQARLLPGAHIGQHDRQEGSSLSSVSARAATDVTLGVLRLEELADLLPAPILPHGAAEPPSARRRRRLALSGLWILALVLVVGLLVGQDVASALSGVLYLRSSRAWEVGDHQQALELLEDAAWFDPESVAVQNQEGYLWFQMDDLNRAQAAFARAVDTDSTNGPALNNLAVTYFATGAAEQAMSLLEDAARYDPDGAIVYYNQGLILLEQQDLTGAVRALKEASHIKPEWSLPHIYLSYVYLQLGDYGQAEQSARSAIRLAPAVEMVHLILAMTLYHQDRSLDALEPVRRALDLAPEDSVARFYNALILRDLGMPGIARTKLEQLLASSDDSQQQARIAAEIETITRSLEQSIWEE